MIRAFRIIAAATIVAALVVQFVLFQTDPAKESALAATVRYFGYFTILSNMIGALALVTAAAAPKSGLFALAATPAMRTAAALYLAIVGVVYHVLLAPRWDPQGWQLATDIVFHTIAPLALAAEWLLATAKQEIRLRVVPYFLIVPLAYGAFTLLRGAVTGFYPYFFLNAAEIGYPATLTNLAGLFAVFAACGAAMIIVGKKLPAPFRNGFEQNSKSVAPESVSGFTR